MNFLKKFIFCSFGIHAKDTKFVNETHHTHRNIDTHRHIHTQTDTDSIFTFYTFWLIWPKIQILYLAYHRLTHAQTLRHAHT